MKKRLFFSCRQDSLFQVEYFEVGQEGKGFGRKRLYLITAEIEFPQPGNVNKCFRGNRDERIPREIYFHQIRQRMQCKSVKSLQTN